MIARLVGAMPVLGSTVIPALVLLSLRFFLKPHPAPPVLPRPVVRCDCCPSHRRGVRVSRIVRRLDAEWKRYRRPTGYLSPAWTVQPREVVTR